MIIEVESYKVKDLFLCGKACSEKELRKKMKHILCQFEAERKNGKWASYVPRGIACRLASAQVFTCR